MSTLKEHVGAVILVGVLIVVMVQIVTRQTGLEHRISAAEAKLDRLESWMVSDRQIQSERHEDIMKVMAEMSRSQTQVLTTINHIDLYYKRAELTR